jgi:hypothetical protein
MVRIKPLLLMRGYYFPGLINGKKGRDQPFQVSPCVKPSNTCPGIESMANAVAFMRVIPGFQVLPLWDSGVDCFHSMSVIGQEAASWMSPSLLEIAPAPGFVMSCYRAWHAAPFSFGYERCLVNIIHCRAEV